MGWRHEHRRCAHLGLGKVSYAFLLLKKLQQRFSKLGPSIWVALFLFRVAAQTAKPPAMRGSAALPSSPNDRRVSLHGIGLAVELSNEVDRFTFAPAPCAEVGARSGSQD
jgi:hypothetical protein